MEVETVKANRPVESWRTCWRDGFAPCLSLPALEALKTAVLTDDTRLCQGGTTVPAPLSFVLDWPCEGACAVGYAGWQGDGLETVGDVEQFFAKLCFEADKRLGEPAGCRWFLNWFDDTPRETMRKELAGEVETSILARHLDELAASRPQLRPEPAFAEVNSIEVPF